MIPLTITQQSHLSPEHAAQFRAIYESSFPAPERGDFAELVDEITTGSRALFTAIDDNNLVGFAVTLRLKPGNVYALEYLAVAQEFRNRGIGEQLLGQASQLLKANANASAIMIEVEPPDEGTPDEQRLRARRIGFYQRLGAKIIDCAPHYRAPNLAGAGTVNFKLLWIPLSDSAVVPMGQQLHDLVLQLYVQSYDLAPNDPLVVASLQDLAC